MSTELPPLVSGGLPLVGHAIEFLRSPLELLRRGGEEHGDLFSLQLGNKKAAVFLGPENSRFFFEETDKLLSIREGYPFFIKMFEENFYFFAQFEEYLRQRAIIMPRFQGKQLGQYVDIMVEETHRLMQQLGQEGTFDLIPTLGPLVMQIAAHAFLGQDFRDRLGQQFFADFRQFSGGMEPVLPLWLPLPKLIKSQKAKRKLHTIFTQLINERRQNPVTPPDFFQLLVQSRYEDDTPVPNDVIINLILLLVWAGHETTAGHISWALIDLLQHPTYLQSLLEEQHQVLGDRLEMSMKEVRQLDQIEWAVKETERLHPVAYILIRMAAETFPFKEYQISEGSMIFATPAISHRLAHVFPEPDVYRPQRFSPAHQEDRRQFSLIGFGGGLHRCAGVNFAYLEMKVVLTLLLQQYEFELVDLNPQPVKGAVTKWPAGPCRVRYRQRQPMPVTYSV